MGKTQCVAHAFRKIGLAIGTLVHDDDLLASRGSPAEDIRHVRWWRGCVDAQMQETNAGLGEHWHDPERMTRHIGHLGGDRPLAETVVEFLRIGEAGTEKRRGHQFRMRRVGQAVPADETVLDRLFKTLDLCR